MLRIRDCSAMWYAIAIDMELAPRREGAPQNGARLSAGDGCTLSIAQLRSTVIALAYRVARLEMRGAGMWFL